MVIYSLRRVFECRLVTFSVWVHLDKLVLARVLKVDPSWVSIACGGAVQGCTNVVEAGCLRTTFYADTSASRREYSDLHGRRKCQILYGTKLAL